MRQRLTTRFNKKADPYSLGREKENPPVEKYMNGDPDTWAETPYDKHLWKGEKREESGHAAEENHNFGPSDKGDVHPGAKSAAIKTAKELRAKAIKCVRIAEALFPIASEEVLEQQGFDLMELSDRAVTATLERIAEMEAAPVEEEKKEEGMEEEEKKEEACEEDEDEMKKEAKELLAKARKLLAEAEEEKKEDEALEEEVVEEEKEEAKEEEVVDSENEKMASLLLKKANSLADAHEYELALGNAKKAEQLKQAAKQALSQAKKVYAGDLSDLPPEMQEQAKAKQEEAKEVDNEKLNTEGLEGEEAELSVEEKKAAAARHLEAAKRLMKEAEEAALSGEDMVAESTSSASNENPSAEAKSEEHPAAEAKEEDEEIKLDEAQEEEEEELGYEMDIDMVPSTDEKDQGLEDLFMDPDMKQAKEEYEEAFGGKKEEAAGDEGKTAKTASKKGAKTLKAGLKISSASEADLSSLWNAPPDVSSYFK